jgi:periplasmic protein TonB
MAGGRGDAAARSASSSTSASPGGGGPGGPPGRGAPGGSPAASGGGGSGLGLGAGDGGTRVASVPGDGAGDGVPDALYGELRRRLQEALVYPSAARRRRLTGVVEVEAEIQPSGLVTNAVVVVSSSHRMLDDAALDTVRGLGRVAFPPDVSPRRLRVRLPVEYTIQ